MATAKKNKKRQWIPHHVICDSNAFISDYWLNKPSAVLLKAYLDEQPGGVFVVPQIVVEEVINKYEQHLNEAFRDLQQSADKTNSSYSRLGSMLNEPKAALVEPPAYRSLNYRAFLKKALEDLLASVPSYKNVRIQSIVRRAIAKRLPFRKDDSGFRDALIWESLLSGVFRKRKRIAFITNDIEAFGSVEKGLHENLMSEISDRGFKRDDVRIFKSIADFSEAHILPYLTAEEKYLGLLQAHKFTDLNLIEAARSHIEVIKDEINRNPQFLDTHAHIDEPEIVSLAVGNTFEVDATSTVTEDEVLFVSFHFPVVVTYKFSLAQEELSEIDDEAVVVNSPSLDNWLATVQATKKLIIQAFLIFHFRNKEIEAFEVEDINEPDE